MLSLVKIKDIHQCEDTDHVYAIVRVSPRATHVRGPCGRPGARGHRVGDPLS